MQSAGPRIDCSPPSSAGLTHVKDKRKKDQQEKERQAVIQVTLKFMMSIMEIRMICFQSQNLIMLQHLSHIARSKRVDDGNMKKMHWKDFYLQIMVNPR